MQFYATHGHTRPWPGREPNAQAAPSFLLLENGSSFAKIGLRARVGDCPPACGARAMGTSPQKVAGRSQCAGLLFLHLLQHRRAACSELYASVPVNGDVLRLMVCLHPSRARDACPQGQCPSVGLCQKSGRRRPQQHPNSRDGSSE